MNKQTPAQQFAAKLAMADDLLTMYRAAKSVGASEQEAVNITAAYLAGLIISTREAKPEENGETQK